MKQSANINNMDPESEVKQSEERGTKQEQQAGKMSLKSEESESMDSSAAQKNLQNVLSVSSKKIEDAKKLRCFLFVFI
jgi:hypothetical protein